MPNVNVERALHTATLCEMWLREMREAFVSGAGLLAESQKIQPAGANAPPPAELQQQGQQALAVGMQLLAKSGKALGQLHREIHGIEEKPAAPNIAGRIGEQLNGQPHG